MHFPTDWPTILKVIGATSAGLGSLVLAWRVKHILEWVTNCIVAHDNNFNQILKTIHGESQTEKVVLNVASTLLSVQDKLGFLLFVLGFALLGAGMLCTAVSYLLPA